MACDSQEGDTAHHLPSSERWTSVYNDRAYNVLVPNDCNGVSISIGIGIGIGIRIGIGIGIGIGVSLT